MVATSPDAAEQAGEQVLQASEGRLQHLRCLAVSSPSASRVAQSQQEGDRSPAGVMRHALAHEGMDGAAAALLPAGEAGQMVAAPLPGATSQGVQPYDPAALVLGLQWLAQHQPEPPVMQASPSLQGSGPVDTRCWGH